MKRIIYTLLVALTVQVGNSYAQKSCATDEHNAQLMLQNPQNQEALKKFDAEFKKYLENFDLSTVKVNNNKGKTTEPSYMIPVVVHVFHQYGVENISDAQIQSEIDFLNKSYHRLNSDTTNTRAIFKDVAGVANVSFRLARKDPKGNLTNGIVRYYSPLTDRGDDDLKTKSVWDSKRYFNIWVVQKIARDAANPNGIIAGYAQFPFAAGVTTSNTDGIMVGYRFIGQIGDVVLDNGTYCVTATHEAGHWLGLYHPFNGDSCELENDGIQETPPRNYDPSANNPNFCSGVNKDGNTCHNDNPDLPDQYENYMDYFLGTCSNNMFTAQQVARMHFCLNSYRPELWSTENLIRTGVDDAFFATPNLAPPIASFDMIPSASLNQPRVCVNKAVAFKDNSYNSSVTSWSWNFGDGATPATSTVQNPPSVSYTTPGLKTVTLTVTGPNGTNTLTKQNYIVVEGPNDMLAGSVHTADWDYLNDFIQKGWYFENETPDAKWVRSTDVQYDGVASLKLNTLTTSNKFNYSLVSPTYDLAGAGNPYLTFNYAFAPNLKSFPKGDGTTYTGDTQDGLIVSVSTDCGKTWLQRYKVAGNTNTSAPPAVNPMSTLPVAGNGATGVPNSVTFTPSSTSQWKNVSVLGGTNIPAQNYIKFKITFNAQGGNNFYIDDLMLGMNSALNDIRKEQIQFKVYPNPFSNQATLSYMMPNNALVSVKLFDLLGKEIATVFEGEQAFGKQEVTIDKQALHLSNGLYIVKMSVGNSSSFSQKILVN